VGKGVGMGEGEGQGNLGEVDGVDEEVGGDVVGYLAGLGGGGDAVSVEVGVAVFVEADAALEKQAE